MTNTLRLASILGAAGAAVFACACAGGKTAGTTAAAASGLTTVDPGPCAPSAGGFTLDIDNPYYPLPVGRALVLKGTEDGKTARVEITVLNQTRKVTGVTTRVVREAEYEGGQRTEISRNYFVQASDGTVCYYGEEVDIYANKQVTGHGGSWLAGAGNNKPGIIMPGKPVANTQFVQENAPGVAGDMSAIVAVGKPVTVPAGTFADAVHARDWNPMEGGTYARGETKVYARGIGLVVDEGLKLVSH